MQYKFRWIYAGLLAILIFVSGFFYYLYPLINHIFLLKKEILALPIAPAKHFHLKSINQYTTKNKDQLLTDLIALIEMNQLKIHAIDFLNGTFENDHRQRLHLRLEGKFISLKQFIFAMNKTTPEIILTNFMFAMNPDKNLGIEIELLLLKPQDVLPSPLNDVHITKNDTLFCDHADQFKQEDTSFISINQMKMVGFIQQGAHISALILLPTAQVIMANTLQILGKEKARVTTITKHRITFVTADKKHLELNL
jgi:Pilus assembly protein, PilP